MPRVYEKIMEGIKAKYAHVNPIRKKVGKWANKMGIQGNYRRQSRSVHCKLGACWTAADPR